MTEKQLELLRFVAQVLLDNERNLTHSSGKDVQDLRAHLFEVEKEAFQS